MKDLISPLRIRRLVFLSAKRELILQTKISVLDKFMLNSEDS